MLFNSYIFWVFFITVFMLYVKAPHKLRTVILLIASYVFYGSWNWKFLSLILISTLVDYVAATHIVKAGTARRKKLLLALSVCTNLGLLGVFKYFNFFAGELVSLLDAMGFQANMPALNVILPVGISFYTFQTMSYTIDVYRGRTQPVRNLLDFALFVCFFPQLVAGPIERFNDLMPQIQQPRRVDGQCFVEGLYHVTIGLFKKIVIADNMANLVNAVFATPPAELAGTECFLGIFAFTFQIYGDFSGYSSIAQGVAKWLGFDLMYNFKMPYFSTSPSEFWRRWHISLSSWLRDYLYIPLGGNRHGTLATYKNLLLTMLLGGLWHGAGWTFIAWGGYHGLILCVYRWLGRYRTAKPDASPPVLPSRAVHDHPEANTSETGQGAAELPAAPPSTETRGWRPRLAHALAMIWMFLLVMLGWLLFRAESMEQVVAILGRIATDWHWSDKATYMTVWMAFLIGPLLLYEYLIYRKQDDMLWLTRQHWLLRAALYTYAWGMMLLMAPEDVHEFIYFQF